MDPSGLPCVRVPTLSEAHGVSGSSYQLEAPIVELPPSHKFSVVRPTHPALSESTATHVLHKTEAQIDFDDMRISEDAVAIASLSTPESAGRNVIPTHDAVHSDPSSLQSRTPPRLSRAFSMPLPSQIGHLKNPRRWLDFRIPPSPIVIMPTSPSAHYHELSLELADSVQMVIQTLLQISPPQLLDPAKEQFSSCTLSIPSPSISAMLTAMKNLNYMSANMSTLGNHEPCDIDSDVDDFSITPTVAQDDFDIGEMLQSVGDALSGLAAQAGVDLVLFHADVGMKHVSVRGDECGLSYALSHVIRQVLDTAKRGDTIEIGLSITAKERKLKASMDFTDTTMGPRPISPSFAGTQSPLQDFEGPLRCAFDIAHKFASSDASPDADDEENTMSYFDHRLRPEFDSKILGRLLRHMRATITPDQTPRLFPHGRACEFSLLLETGSASVLTKAPSHAPEIESIRQPFANANIQLANEPSLEELMLFVETLKGKKVVLHASAKGSFAHHLTSYLTAWGLDVSHTSTAPSMDLEPELSLVEPAVGPSSGPLTGNPLASSGLPLVATPAPMSSDGGPLETAKPGGPPAFVLIDDDVSALRMRLVQLRTEPPYALHLHSRQRPSLAANHRPRSSPHVVKAKGIHPTLLSSSTSPPPVIIHFTSLSNYKLVKDVLQSVLSHSPSSSGLIPEVIVIPKPAGPRRLLTALRTAIIKPIVDPFFSPIATSPMSPSVHGLGAPFFSQSSPNNKSGRPPISPRTAPDRSPRSTANHPGEAVNLLPPSPLSHSDSMEYFSEAAVKLGTSPSSGLVIQSPDGQPAGIFFHPRGAAHKSQKGGDGSGSGTSTPLPTGDPGNLRLLMEWRKGALSRRPTSDTSPSPNERLPNNIPLMRPPLLPRSRSSLFYPIEDSAGSPLETVNEADSTATPVATLPKGRPSVSPRSDSGRLSSTSSPLGISTTAISGSPSGRSSAGVAGPVDALIRTRISPPGSPLMPRTPGGSKRGTRRMTDNATITAAAKKARAGAESNIVPPINVLIVEDNPINQTILSTFMKKKKIKYDVAKNGEEAVNKWKTGTFHLILMDIQMPVMDGIDATKEIRRLEKINAMAGFPSTPTDGTRTPSESASTDSRSSSVMAVSTPFRSSVIIVALTASALQSDRVAALAAGCNDFLTKPVSLLWLNSKIIEWGSIKALQMWADLRPEVVKSISNGQAAAAKSVASRLHVPPSRARSMSAKSHPPESPHIDLPKPPDRAMSLRLGSLSPVGTPTVLTPSVDTPRPSLTHPFVLDAQNPPLVADAESMRSLGITVSEGDGSAYAADSSLEPDEEQITDSVYHTPLQYNLDQLPSSTRRTTPPQLVTISSGDALLTHFKGQASYTAAQALDHQPVLLGERNRSSGNLSIAEVPHQGSDQSTQSTDSHTSLSREKDT